MVKKVQKLDALNLEVVCKSIEEKFGPGTIVDIFQDAKQKVEVIPTDSLLLNEILGVGGFARGRIYEIFGEEGTGKSTIALNAIKNCQDMGGEVLYFDVEHALNMGWVKQCGITSLRLSQPDTGEETFDILEATIKSGQFAMMVVDSVANLVPAAELEGTMEDNNVALLPRIMAKGLRKITAAAKETNTLVIFINQLRSDISYGKPIGSKKPTGGNALKFYASGRLELKKVGKIKKGENVVGDTIRATVIKNKVAPPYRVCELTLLHGYGFSFEDDLITVALKNGLLQAKGAWYSYGGENIAQGLDNLRKYIQNNKEFSDKLKAEING